MARARKDLRQNLSLIDVVMELLDARIPRASHIPDFINLVGNKDFIVVMNKCDLADPAVTRKWMEHFASSGLTACAIDAKTGDGVATLLSLAREMAARRGVKRLRPFRTMAVGVPNVGKSSLLNRFASHRSARTGERPGITRGKQWIRVAEDLELLDLPGILWPERSDLGRYSVLCMTGAVPDEAYDIREVSAELFELLRKVRLDLVVERYGEDAAMTPDAHDVLTKIAAQRGFLGPGGVQDETKAAQAIMSDFRSGRLGRLTLEIPGD